MTVLEVAELLSVSTRTVYSMVSEKQIPHFRARGKILFNRELIEAWTRQESLKSVEGKFEEVEA